MILPPRSGGASQRGRRRRRHRRLPHCDVVDVLRLGVEGAPAWNCRSSPSRTPRSAASKTDGASVRAPPPTETAFGAAQSAETARGSRSAPSAHGRCRTPSCSTARTGERGSSRAAPRGTLEPQVEPASATWSGVTAQRHRSAQASGPKRAGAEDSARTACAKPWKWRQREHLTSHRKGEDGHCQPSVGCA